MTFDGPPLNSGWPGPFKCPDCGTWWTGFAHRCTPVQGVLAINTGSAGPTVRCTCPLNRGDNYVGTCPIHDTQSTYTEFRA